MRKELNYRQECEKQCAGYGNMDNSNNPHFANEKNVTYEYGGYQIRVHFSAEGEKTLLQCIQNLVERRIKA